MRAAFVTAVLMGCLAVPAQASTVAVDALGGLGDAHVLYPPYSSPDRSLSPVTVAGVGDVDADGHEDTALVLESYEPAYPSSVWVTFTPAGLPATVAAGEPGWRGFRIVGDHFTWAVAGLGDVNGDGLGEVAVCHYGGITVVFGRLDNGTVDVSNLGDGGFHISGTGSGVGTGFGHTSWGSAFENTSITDAGDQNGDLRPDLAFRAGNAVKVAYSPPSPAGAVVDSNALGLGGFTLDTGSGGVASPYVGMLDDLNSDGRRDLFVAWHDDDSNASHGVGVVAPLPGETVNLQTAADLGKGFELLAPGTGLENGITMGDQNGDGRRDVGLVTTAGGRELDLAYTPPLGTERTIKPPKAGEGELIYVYNGNVIDVGDQDGDGRSDLAFSDVVRFSSTGSVGYPANPGGAGGAMFLAGQGGIIVGSLADRNGDSRREVVAVHAAPYDDEPPGYVANWLLDVFLSAPPPTPIDVELPDVVGDVTDVVGTWGTSPLGDTRSLAARPSVEIRDSAGLNKLVSGDLIDANARTTRAAMRLDTAGLVPGRTYSYRMLLENGRGLVGRSEPRSFVYRPGAPARDTVAPVLRSLSLRPARFRRSTRVRYRLSEAARVTLTVERARATRRGTRWVKLRGTIVKRSRAGATSFRWSGRLRGRRLAPGRYRLSARAVDAAGNRSALRRARFARR